MSQSEKDNWLVAAVLMAIALVLRFVPGLIRDHGHYVIKLALVQENAALLVAVVALLFVGRAVAVRVADANRERQRREATSPPEKPQWVINAERHQREEAFRRSRESKPRPIVRE